MGFKCGCRWKESAKVAAKIRFRATSDRLVLSAMLDGAFRLPKQIHESIRAPHCDVVQVLAGLERSGLVENTSAGWTITDAGRNTIAR